MALAQQSNLLGQGLTATFLFPVPVTTPGARAGPLRSCQTRHRSPLNLAPVLTPRALEPITPACDRRHGCCLPDRVEWRPW